MEQFSFTAHRRFDILKLRGDIKVGILPSFAPVLHDRIAEHPHLHIVLDLSELSAIDQSAVRLLANIRKKLESNGKKLYLLQAPPAAAAILKKECITDEIADIHELERSINEDLYRTVLPYATDEHGLKRIRCGCMVCGSRNVVGYLLDQNSYVWKWHDDDLFPACRSSTGEPFDFFSALPLVCLDCFMVSTDLYHFTIFNAEDAVARRSTLSENAKIQLTKNIKKRKKIVDGFEESEKEDFFLHPRARQASYAAYLLADSCMRTLALNKTDADPFLVGFINYVSLRYAEEERQKREHIDNCRTWLTQALRETKVRSHSERAQALFILVAAALTYEKVKDAAALMQEFTAMMETISYSKTATTNIGAPLFWFTQAQELWRRDVEKKSRAIA